MSSFLRTATRASSSAARAFSTTAQRPLARMTVLGNLGAAPELSATSTGREVVRYTVASNYGRGESRVTSWFYVNCFEPTQGLKQFLLGLPKGSQVFVEADASINQYTDEQGKNQSRLNLIQRNIEVVRRPYNANSQAEQGEEEAAGEERQ